MSTLLTKSLSQLKDELRRLQHVEYCEEVMAVKRKVLAARQPQIAELERQIEELRVKRPAKAPRWPDSTPENVMKAAEARWKGTCEFSTFRIHMWNSKAYWTSYPSGGYSTLGGWVKAPASFDLVSLTDVKMSMGRLEGKVLATLSGRISKTEMARIMFAHTKEPPAA